MRTTIWSKIWAVIICLGFAFILAQAAQQVFRPVRFAAWKDGDHLKVEVYDVVVDVPPDRDSAGIFLQFPDHSYQFVPVREKRK